MALSTVGIALTRHTSILRSSSLCVSLSLSTSIHSLFTLLSFPSSRARHRFIAMASTPQEKVTAPFGSWKSPITADVISSGEKRLGGITADGHGRLLLLESRPTEGGYILLLFSFVFVLN